MKLAKVSKRISNSNTSTFSFKHHMCFNFHHIRKIEASANNPIYYGRKFKQDVKLKYEPIQTACHCHAHVHDVEIVNIFTHKQRTGGWEQATGMEGQG